MSGIWILPPTSGGGGEGGTGEVKWIDIKNKPTEFNPAQHQHQKEDVIGLGESLDLKVDKVDGKGLSSNDFTNEDKKKLEKLSEIEIDGDLVKSVNSILPDEQGNVKLSKNDLGLDKIENKSYTPLTDFNSHIDNKEVHVTSELLEAVKNNSEALKDVATQSELEEKLKELEIDYKEMDEILMARIIKEAELIEGKVDIEEGKGLSSNDFTNEDKQKLDSLEQVTGIVKSVNNSLPDEKGDVKISKKSLGLENVLNLEQATKKDFNALKVVVETNSESILELNTKSDLHSGEIKNLNEKVDNLDFPEAPVLSVNEKTGHVVLDKESIGLGNVLNQEQASKVKFDKHVESSTQKILSLENQSEDTVKQVEGISGQVDKLTDSLSLKVDKEPDKGLSTNDYSNTDKMTVEQNKKEIEAIKEILNSGEEPVELPPTFKVYEEGHIYGLGGMIYDIINNNIVTGNLAPRFVYDNIDLFKKPDVFLGNTINIYYDGNKSSIEAINNKDDSFFKGKLKNILNVDREVKHSWFLNGEESRGFKIETEYLGNVFNLPIRWADIYDETPKVASIGMNIASHINFTDSEKISSISRSLSNTITNNEFTFLDRKNYDIDFSIHLTYADTKEYGDSIEILLSVIDNKFYFTEDMEKIQDIKYTDPEAELYDPYSVSGKKSVYLRLSLRDNRFDSEVSRVFKEDFEYVASRQKNTLNPILNNITIDHYLNQKMRLTANKNYGSDELTETIVANKNSPVNKDNVKNIIISSEEPAKTYEGLIWIDTSPH